MKVERFISTYAWILRFAQRFERIAALHKGKPLIFVATN